MSFSLEKRSLNALFLAVKVSSFSERANTAASPDKLVNLLYMPFGPNMLVKLSKATLFSEPLSKG